MHWMDEDPISVALTPETMDELTAPIEGSICVAGLEYGMCGETLIFGDDAPEVADFLRAVRGSNKPPQGLCRIRFKAYCCSGVASIICATFSKARRRSFARLVHGIEHHGAPYEVELYHMNPTCLTHEREKIRNRPGAPAACAREATKVMMQLQHRADRLMAQLARHAQINGDLPAMLVAAEKAERRPVAHVDDFDRAADITVPGAVGTS